MIAEPTSLSSSQRGEPSATAAPPSCPPAPKTRVRVGAVMSVPRVGWNDSWGCVHQALSRWSIPIMHHDGMFWGECLQRVMKQAIGEGYDWLLTIDYDSMFTAEHVGMLMASMANDPTIDCVAALQPRRAFHTPLGRADGVKFSRRPFRVDSAHFGLTLIRADKLARTPKPWFHSQPDEAGDWGNDCVEADVWFWKQWAKAGNTVYIDPRCKIGHLEVVCVDFVERSTPTGFELVARSATPADWRAAQGGA